MRLIYFLSISAFLSAIASSLLAPVEALYLGSLSKDTSLIGIAIGAASITSLLFYPVLGKFSDRRGRKNIILLFALLGSFVPLLLALTKTIESYILLKLVGGVFLATSAIALALIGDVVERTKSKGLPFGIYIAGASLGGAVGSLVSGYVASFAGSLRTPYFLAFLVSIVSFVFLLPLAKHKEELPKITDAAAKAPRKIPLMVVAILVLGFLFSSHMSMKGLLWPHITQNFVAESHVPFYVGLTFASMGLIAGIFSTVAGKFGDKFGNKKLFFLGYGLMGIFGILLAFPSSFSVFYVLSVLYAFGEVLKGPSTSVLLTEYVGKENRGFIFGIISSVATLGSFAGPAVTGGLMKLIGWNEILFAYGLVILVFTAGFALLLNSREKK